MNAAAPDALARLTRLKDVWLHDYEEQGRIQRAALAMYQGLSPGDYVTPLPGTVDSSTTNVYFGAPGTPQPAVSPQAPVAAPTVVPLATTAGQAPATAPASPGPSLLQRVSPYLLGGVGILGAALGGTALGGLLHPAAPAPATPAAAAPQAPAAPKPIEIEVDYKMGSDGKWIVIPKQVTPSTP